MKSKLIIILAAIMIIVFSSCGGQDTPVSSAGSDRSEISSPQQLKLRIGDTIVQTEWENNESVEALRDMVKSEPLRISTSMYGGFEQVGELGKELPSNDEQMETRAGDIVLYSGNQIVLFYGSNTWEYTKLGKITGMSREELEKLLGKEDTTITLEME